MPSFARSFFQDVLSPAGATVLERSTTAAAPEPRPAPPEPRRRSERRGPLRPTQLISPRARMDGRAPERAFRMADGALVGGLAALFCALSRKGDLLMAPVAATIPYIVGAVLIVWALDGFGAYRFTRSEGLTGHLLKTTGAFAPAALVLWALERTPRFAATGAAVAGVWLAICFLAVGLAHVGWWGLVGRWRAGGKLTPNIVVVGATKNAEKLIQALLDSREANVLGVFDDRLARAPANVQGVPVLGDTQALLSHRLMPYVDRIVVTVPSSAQGRVRQIMERLRVLPNPLCLFLDFGAERAGAAIERLANAPVATLDGVPRDERRAFWKRVQDLVIGGIALVVALPVMAALAVLIRLDSPGPVLFRQRRHGFNNEEIVVWKFRSMRHDAGSKAGDDRAARQVSANDDRVTRIGRVIRLSSLDELPQLFNVLKGEMSLVGPRPHAIGMRTGESESAKLVAEYAHRHRLKPGLTGWAAIHGSRGPVDTPELVRRRIALDIEYVERQSFWLDLYILAMTLPCLLGDRAVVR
jgi:polysaccharide biosynthesis protein PslA